MRRPCSGSRPRPRVRGCGAFAAGDADPTAEPERIGVVEAFARYAGIDLLATLDGTVADGPRLAAAARAAGLRTAADDSWSDVFSRILSDRVERHLGLGRPTVLDLYPAPEAALARPSPADPRLAERFELYVCGVEIANGFGELTDAAEQRRRFEAAMAARRDRGQEAYPIDEDFLSALASMPEASGIALGFDRLVMLAAGAQSVDQVLWLPVAAACRGRCRRGPVMSGTLRSLDDLRAAGLLPPGPDAALAEVADRYAVAVSPAMAALIDPTDPQDPIALQFVPRAAERDQTPDERADPIGDAVHSPVPGIVHRYPGPRPPDPAVRRARSIAGSASGANASVPAMMPSCHPPRPRRRSAISRSIRQSGRSS